MYVGLTGGIGAGKSTVADMFAALGAFVISADELAHRALAPGSPLIAQVAAIFPGVVSGGVIDRKKLADAVFADSDARVRLEHIVHPQVAAWAQQARAAAEADRIVIYDVPLIVEKGMADQFDAVVVVVAPADVRIQRLVRRGLTESDAVARMASQASDVQREEVADFIISNDGGLEHLREQVTHVYSALSAYS